MECWEVVVSRRGVFDPQKPFIRRCNKIFLVLCAVSLLIDPLFFYVLGIDDYRKCLSMDTKLETMAMAFRFAMDSLYIIHIIFQFHTGYYGHSYIVVSRGDLIKDYWMIARRYLRSYFTIDVMATLPLPQVAILLIVPNMGGLEVLNTINLLKFILTFQFVPRFLRFYKLLMETMNSSNGGSGIARNRVTWALLFYIWNGHVVGGYWYLFAMERETVCWQRACQSDRSCDASALPCNPQFRDEPNVTVRRILDALCPPDLEGRSPFDFGMFIDAHNSGVLASDHWPKFMYCFWWALQNLSTLGQNLKTSTNVWEICFALAIFICGLVLLSFVVGIIQETMLSMLSARTTTENMKRKWQDVENWMDVHHLPQTLRDRVRQNQQLKWGKNQVLDVDNLLENLPKDLRRDITGHLCRYVILRVPVFEEMKEEQLAAIFERLKQVRYAKKTYIFRKGDPIDEIVFIMRGDLIITIDDNGSTGFSTDGYLRAGDFCGGELLFQYYSHEHPVSSRTVRTLTEVEAFALKTDDFKFVISRLDERSRQKFHCTLRFYSPAWRTWAACYIQTAWRRHQEKKRKQFSIEEKNRLQEALAKSSENSLSLGAAMYVSRFALRARRGSAIGKPRSSFTPVMPRKPAEFDSTGKAHQV